MKEKFQMRNATKAFQEALEKSKEDDSKLADKLEKFVSWNQKATRDFQERCEDIKNYIEQIKTVLANELQIQSAEISEVVDVLRGKAQEPNPGQPRPAVLEHNEFKPKVIERKT